MNTSMNSRLGRNLKEFSSRNCLARACSVLLLVILGTGVGVGTSRAQTTSTFTGTVTDKQGLGVAGATVLVEGNTVGTSRSVSTDANGEYHVPGLPAGIYSITVSHDGFATRVSKNLELTLNRTVTLNVALEVGSNKEEVLVSSDLPLLETASSASASTITPDQILNVPLNGRNYLDLLQLVPGVAINRQADQGSDNATNVLGERGGNTGFLIDGLPNRDELNGGAAAQFNQETIAEFQVITTGYEAEFGHASGGIVNVITKSGTNTTHGTASGFHRNSAFDSSDIPGTNAPFLVRWDYSLAGGGAIVRDKIFWFGSAENIHEARQLNFTNPPFIPAAVEANELSYNYPTSEREVRTFFKLDEVVGQHRLSQQVNYTNSHIGNFNPLSASTSLPSTRINIGQRNLLLGFSDTATLGSSSSPFILSLRGQYRRQPSSSGAAHPDAGPNTIFNVFTDFSTGGIFGDQGQVVYGALTTPTFLDQLYGTFGASLSKTINRHTVKFGWDYERTQVDGTEANLQQDQLFATNDDYVEFGPINSGFFLLYTIGGATPEANKIKLRNNYNGLFVQDDWKITKTLTLNLGVRWDYDSEFKTKKDFSPRLGFAWAVTPKTVLRGSWGLFYDHFRLGIARDIPGFGGADLRTIQPLSYPRLFSGVPTIAPALFGLCLDPIRTDAQIASSGTTCPFFTGPIYGVDHLNNVVAPGHATIPVNTVVNQSNIQTVSGFTPDEYLLAADSAIGRDPGYLFWGPYGALSYLINAAGNYPVTIDPRFSTPYSRNLSFGVQRQIASDWVVSGDFYHKGIENILGVRQTNLPFDARITGFAGGFTNGFGPWYNGRYNAGIFSINKRLSHRYTFGASYTYASEIDNALCSNFDSGIAGTCYPTDSFVGTTTLVTGPGGVTNADGPFTTPIGYVPKAGIKYNGPNLDEGPSDFALRNTFEIHGLIQLPWRFELSSLFRAQSGYRYSQVASAPLDQDGNGNYNGRDLVTARNQFTAPPYVNMDLRVAKTFRISERVKLQAMFEFFNLFNNANPAAIQLAEQGATDPNNPGATQPFGAVSQRLPGREGQIGLRLEF